MAVAVLLTASASAAAAGASAGAPAAFNKRGFAVSSGAASPDAGAGTGAAAGPSKLNETSAPPPAHARGPASAGAEQWLSARKKVAAVNQVAQLPNAEKLRYSVGEDSASQLTPEELKLKRRLSLTDGDDRYSHAKGKKDKPGRLRRGTVKDGCSPAAKATATAQAAAAACRGGAAEAPAATSSTADAVQFL